MRDSGEPPSRLVCGGCGASPSEGDPYPFRCPNFGAGDVDHVLVRRLDFSRVLFPLDRRQPPDEPPFVRYRQLLNSYHRAIEGGVADADFVDLVRRLDGAVAGVDGRGFSTTPFGRDASISDALGFDRSGGVWVKNETGNVSGSHKARHLMGVLLHLEVAEMIGLADGRKRPPLAIASCGNAALAAAVVAAAAGRRLRVFVPVDADPSITGRLAELGSEVVTCRREPGVAGDPTYLRLLAELDDGALPFTCQGNLNGLAIEGGETLGYEIVSRLGEDDPPTVLDHLVIQVGGGALASSCWQALSEAVALGALARCPRLHTIQTRGAHPLERAYRRLRDEIPSAAGGEVIEAALRHAATHRSQYMWPWESEPKSIATGILDDETYDWLAVVRAMLASGGRPVVASEECLAEGHEIGTRSGYRVDPTGSAGLAGLLELIERGLVGPGEKVGVLFTGTER